MRPLSLRTKLVCTLAAIVTVVSCPLVYFAYSDTVARSVAAAEDKFERDYLQNVGALVSTSVGPLPEENREEMLFELLNGQYYFRRTAGATLAADYRRTRLEAGGRSAASASGSGSGAGVRNIAGAASASAGALSDEDLMRAARSMAAV